MSIYFISQPDSLSFSRDLFKLFKISLCIFPFFVMIWFNSENRDNLLDKIFPINFMKNTLKFYKKFLDDEFFDSVKLNL